MRIVFDPRYITNNIIFWIFVISMIIIMITTIVFVIKEVGGKR